MTDPIAPPLHARHGLAGVGPATGGRRLRRPHRHLCGGPVRHPAPARVPDVGQRLATPDRRSRDRLPGQLPEIPNSDLLGQAVLFTIEVHLDRDGPADRTGARPGPDRPGGSRWVASLRTASSFPCALGLASASLLFYALYSPEIGPFTGSCRRSGSRLLLAPPSALISTVLLVVWRFAGFYMLILLVGLQSHPAGGIRGGRDRRRHRWQTFRRITLPLLRPSLALSLILCVTGSLLAFDQFYILTKGGPDNSTITVVQLIYNEAFQRPEQPRPAAALSVIVLPAWSSQRRPVPRPARNERDAD